MSTHLYRDDYTAWLAEQAAALRRLRDAGANLPLDFELLAEELDDMGRELRAGCASHLVTVLQHLLKLQHSPAEDPRRGWENSIRMARVNVERRITKTIRNELEDDLDRLYATAHANAKNDLEQHHETAAAALPRVCPYGLDQALDLEWWPKRAATVTV